jgi:ferrous-iron efflux pump FieF
MKFSPRMSLYHLTRSASYLAVVVSVILIASKIFGVLITHSLSIEASLFDSCLDGGVSLLNAWAVHEAFKPADREHRFGHGKVEALVGLAQSAFIAISALFLLKEAYQRFLHPQHIHFNTTIIIIMIGATFLTIGLVFWQNYVIKKTGSLIITSDSLHYKADILTNLAAIFGCMLGAYFPSFDVICGILVALYIMKTSWTIAIQSLDILMDKELTEETRQTIKEIVQKHPDVLGIHDLRTRNAGHKNFAQFHLDLNAELTLRQAHIVTEDVERMLTSHFPYFEFLIHQDPHHECACYERSYVSKNKNII